MYTFFMWALYWRISTYIVVEIPRVHWFRFLPSQQSVDGSRCLGSSSVVQKIVAGLLENKIDFVSSSFLWHLLSYKSVIPVPKRTTFSVPKRAVIKVTPLYLKERWYSCYGAIRFQHWTAIAVKLCHHSLVNVSKKHLLVFVNILLTALIFTYLFKDKELPWDFVHEEILFFKADCLFDSWLLPFFKCQPHPITCTDVVPWWFIRSVW